ncbi:MAG TPA: GNAT family N-acetyltransferase [Candidatus Acidoferrales bacterium]|nr:GNAT family N-acetyltransferase [Candidatus Acidoferrales bacterium]
MIGLSRDPGSVARPGAGAASLRPFSIMDPFGTMTTNEHQAAERQRPAMYMLWPHQRGLPDVPSFPPAYRLYTVASERLDEARAVVETDGAMSDSEWRRFCDSVVPDGLFVVVEDKSSAWVGSIGAAHNPAATRFYFPGGGQLGYLVVLPDHRGRGLGAALAAAAVRRLLHGGYRHIFLGVQDWRLAAIRSYLRLGFQPFIHAPELAERWRSVFGALGCEPRELDWPTSLYHR